MEAVKDVSSKINIENLYQYIVGFDKKVPLLDGRIQRYINFDNAASTPALKPVLEKVNEAMEWYSSIHRGTGFKSQICSEIYDQGREVVAEFVKADPAAHAIIFGKNATEAINKLACRYPFQKNQVVLVSKMEHHSNDLPWRAHARVIHVGILEDGQLDEQELIRLLKKHWKRVTLVAVTGASNVTGWVNDINRLAEICHEHHTKIMIDAAQLAPHRRIDMRTAEDPGHLDFLVFSAHKIYAPFGSGVLIGDRDFFEKGNPEYVGGGTVKIVGLDYAHWTEAPEKEEAGTPNIIGVVALAKSLLAIKDLGMQNIAEHEKRLTSYLLEKMKQIPGIKIYGSSNPAVLENRLGVIAFNLQGMPHALTAAILNYEGGVGVRNGCFCAHPYVKLLMGIGEKESREIEEQMLQGDRSNLPGAVRASFGMYNTREEVKLFIDILRKIAAGKYQGKYLLDRVRGEYHPQDHHLNFEEYFQL